MENIYSNINAINEADINETEIYISDLMADPKQKRKSPIKFIQFPKSYKAMFRAVFRDIAGFHEIKNPKDLGFCVTLLKFLSDKPEPLIDNHIEELILKPDEVGRDVVKDAKALLESKGAIGIDEELLGKVLMSIARLSYDFLSEEKKMLSMQLLEVIHELENGKK